MGTWNRLIAVVKERREEGGRKGKELVKEDV